MKAGALKAVLQISMMDDIDMKFWSTSLLLNLSMSAEVLKEEVVKSGGVKVLIDLAVNDTDEPQIAIQAAKTLVMLGFLGMHILIRNYFKVMSVIEKKNGTGGGGGRGVGSLL